MNDRIIVSSIRDLNLHDSELLDVVVKMDEITMHLDYIEDYETMKCTHRDLVFQWIREIRACSFRKLAIL